MPYVGGWNKARGKGTFRDDAEAGRTQREEREERAKAGQALAAEKTKAGLDPAAGGPHEAPAQRMTGGTGGRPVQDGETRILEVV